MYLGHYTTLRSLEKILFNKKLRLGSFDKTKDPFENKRLIQFLIRRESGMPVYTDADSEIKRDIKKCFKLICFTRSKNIDEIINKPRMWAQYSRNHQGCCLILNKEIFDKAFKKLKQRTRKLAKSRVYYNLEKKKNEISSEIYRIESIEGKIAETYIEEKFFYHRKLFLFRKMSDWKEEKEYRYVIYSKEKDDSEIYIDIKDSLNRIVLGEYVSTFYEELLKEWAEKNDTVLTKMDWDEGFPREHEVYPPSQNLELIRKLYNTPQKLDN